MKTKRIQPRKHGPSRLEKLLQDSIRHELQIKALWCYVRSMAPPHSWDIKAQAYAANLRERGECP